MKNGSYPNLMFNNDPRTRTMQHRADPNYKNIKTFADVLPHLVGKISKNPGEYFSWYLFGKPFMFFSWNIVAGMGDIYVYPIRYSPYFNVDAFRITHMVMKSAHPVIVVTSLLMLLLVLSPATRRHIPEQTRIPLTFCALLLLYFTLLHVVANPLPRYAIPLRPIQILMATCFFSWLLPLLKKIHQSF